MISNRVLKLMMAFGAVLIVATATGRSLRTAAAQAAESNLTGVWQGTTQAYCGANTLRGRCNAVQKITLDLQHEGETIKGGYKCAYGNMVCRNLNTTGRIVSGSYSSGGVIMRILMPDASTCRFSGRFNDKSGSGNYNCYFGSKTVEAGMWRVTRGM